MLRLSGKMLMSLKYVHLVVMTSYGLLDCLIT